MKSGVRMCAGTQGLQVTCMVHKQWTLWGLILKAFLYKIWLSMLWRGLFGNGHQERPLFLHQLLNYPPAKTAIDLSGQPMGVIFIWCTRWTQSFNSPGAHLMHVLGGGLARASSFLFQQETQEGRSKVPWVHGASSILSQLGWQSPASHPDRTKAPAPLMTATGMAQQLLYGSIPFSPFGGACPEPNIYLLSLTTSSVVSKSF